MRLPEVVLKECAVLSEQVGWCQEQYQDAHGALCMLGLIGQVCNNDPASVGHFTRGAEAIAAQTLLAQRVLEAAGEPMFIDNWNDKYGRTHAEVLAVLKGEQ